MDSIIFYHTETCPQCRMVKMLLDKYNIEHESSTSVDEMKEKGITHTPALEVNGTILQGKELMNYINQFKK